ncbi:MAG: hypothetical protein ACK4TA_22205 [Saprospiraceae bacterium]
MKAPRLEDLDDVTKLLQDIVLTLNDLTCEFMEEYDKNRPIIDQITPLADELQLIDLDRKKISLQTRQLQHVFELAAKVANLQSMFDGMLEHLKNILRLAEIGDIDRAQQFHSKLKDVLWDKPYIKPYIRKLHIMYRQVRAEKS